MNNFCQSNIAGVDEVGRGSLFGPVFAAAVLLNKTSEKILISKGLNDSKKLSPCKRNYLEPLIKNNCIEWGIGQSSHQEIDQFGIRRATEIAMIRALEKIHQPIRMVLIDGNLPIEIWEGPQQSIVKGDSIYPSISAASILAKVSRDALIKRISNIYPGYELNKNVGYGTSFHRDALKNLGATELHRRSFLSKIIKF